MTDWVALINEIEQGYTITMRLEVAAGAKKIMREFAKQEKVRKRNELAVQHVLAQPNRHERRKAKAESDRNTLGQLRLYDSLVSIHATSD